MHQYFWDVFFSVTISEEKSIKDYGKLYDYFIIEKPPDNWLNHCIEKHVFIYYETKDWLPEPVFAGSPASCSFFSSSSITVAAGIRFEA